MPKKICEKCGAVISYSKFDNAKDIKCPRCLDISDLPDLPEVKAAEGKIEQITKATNERKKKRYKRPGFEGTKNLEPDDNDGCEVPELQ